MKYGMGRHETLIKNPKAWTIVICCPHLWSSAKLVTDMEQVVLSSQVLYCASLSTIKLAILLLYDRIFGFPKPMFRYLLLAVGGFVVAYGVAGVLGTILQCVSQRDLWKPTSYFPPICHFSKTLVFSLGLVNIVTDITMLSLPIPLVWSLLVSKLRKWQLVLVFSLGGL